MRDASRALLMRLRVQVITHTAELSSAQSESTSIMACTSSIIAFIIFLTLVSLALALAAHLMAFF